MITSVGERPAASLEGRIDQLRRALPAPEADGDAAVAWRGFLDSLSIGVWEAVGRGDHGAPRRVLDELGVLAGWVEDHLPPAGPAPGEAARELDVFLRWLDGAVDAGRVPALEARLRQPTAIERAVLQVLLSKPGEALTRGDVHKAMPEQVTCSPARISQVLESLHADGLVVRTYGRARGAKEVAHYLLWESGVEVCERVGIGALAAPPIAPRLVESTDSYTLVFSEEKSRRYQEQVPRSRLWADA